MYVLVGFYVVSTFYNLLESETWLELVVVKLLVKIAQGKRSISQANTWSLNCKSQSQGVTPHYMFAKAKP